MEWETKIELAEALNDGDNKKACEIVLNNEMDMQAWDMFLTGMNLSQCKDYRPILSKLKENKKDISEKLGLREFLRMNILIKELEDKQ